MIIIVTATTLLNIYGGRAFPRGPGGSMNWIPYVLMAGWSKENLPGGSLKYLFVYVGVRIYNLNVVTAFLLIDCLSLYPHDIAMMKSHHIPFIKCTYCILTLW